tara:strand:+ start:226 stop:2064 length:1839 start_codon:yes stop_codon:yes gene_type:complete
MEPTIEQILRKGVEAHKEGKLQEAESLYRTILQSQPLHPDANHNLGVLALSANKTDTALTLFKNALEANPKIEQFWLSYIDALIKEKQFGIANQVIEKGKKQGVAREKLAEAHSNLGNILQEVGRLEEAEASYIKAIALKSDFFEAYYNLGNTLKKLIRLEEAEASYIKAIALKSDFSQAHNNLGITLKDQGKLEEAEASYIQAIALKPDYFDAHNNLGVTLNELGRLEEAEASFTESITLKPDFAEAYFNLGNILRAQGKIKDAEKSYLQAIAINSDYTEAYNNLGFTLTELGRLEEAAKVYKKIIDLKPDHAEARMNLEKVMQGIVPAWHINMMNDELRNNAFFEAIKLAVNKDSLVFEIGTGSGLLSMMAIESGAKKVVTCETIKTIAENAKKIIHKNGYQKKINVINKKSTEVKIGKDIPRQADLIISEILSSEFVGEGVRESISDANKRLLKKNGRIIPQSGCIKIALLGDTKEIKKSIYADKSCGFDLSDFNSISQSKFMLKLKEKPKILSDAVDAFTINIENINSYSNEEKVIRLQANQDGLCLGLIQWIKVKLYDDIEYENIPYKVQSHWNTPIYVFDEPIELKKGQFLDIKGFLDEDSLWFSM